MIARTTSKWLTDVLKVNLRRAANWERASRVNAKVISKDCRGQH